MYLYEMFSQQKYKFFGENVLAVTCQITIINVFVVGVPFIKYHVHSMEKNCSFVVLKGYTDML